ncbi:unnamed protein product [Prunus armeniaca]|uniref:Uncharacterized protein n=1 Tax=Prunus armeniaca TaxID=36596 RepID=A0A6J5X1H2_PRUAR|nr:unnamed protein product [Prunus armeniaca]
MELPSQSEYHSDSVANPDGLIGGFISHIVGDIMTSKQDMVSDHELEVVLICNVGLHFVLCDIYSTCHMRHREAWLRLVGAWDAGFRERKSVSESESESSERQRSRGRKKRGMAEGKSATFEP